MSRMISSHGSNIRAGISESSTTSDGEEVLLVDVRPHCTSGGCRAVFLGEFQRRHFGLIYHRRQAFYTSQWEWPPVVFLLYRFVAAAYVVAWLTYTAASMPVVLGFSWLAWLTNWSYTVLACHLVLSLIITMIHHQGACWHKPPIQIAVSVPPDEEAGPPQTDSASGTLYGTSTGGQTVASGGSTSGMEDVEIVAPQVFIPWYIKLQWLLFAIISNFAIVVTVVYFTALYPYMNETGFAFVVDFHLHGVNTIIIMTEMALSALPVRLLHVIYPLIYGLSYVVFSIIIWAIDHDNVLYKGVLDWNQPVTTVIVLLCLAFLALPLLQLTLWALYRLRLYLYYSIYSTRAF